MGGCVAVQVTLLRLLVVELWWRVLDGRGATRHSGRCLVCRAVSIVACDATWVLADMSLCDGQ